MGLIKNKDDITLGLGELEIGIMKGDILRYRGVGAIKHNVQLVERREAGGSIKTFVVADFAEFNPTLIALLCGGRRSPDALFLDESIIAPSGTLTSEQVALKAPTVFSVGAYARKARALRFTHCRRDGSRDVIEAMNAKAFLTFNFNESDWNMLHVEFELIPDARGVTHRLFFEKRNKKMKRPAPPIEFEAGRPLVTIMAPTKPATKKRR